MFADVNMHGAVEQPAAPILCYALHTAQCYTHTCQQTAAACQTVQMFTPLQNAVTKQ